MADDSTTNSVQDESEGTVEIATSLVSSQHQGTEIADNVDGFKNLEDTQASVTVPPNDCAAPIVDNDYQGQDTVTSDQDSVFYESQDGLLAMESVVDETILDENQELIDGTAVYSAEPIAIFAYEEQDMVINGQESAAHHNNGEELLAMEQGTDSHEEELAKLDRSKTKLPVVLDSNHEDHKEQIATGESTINDNKSFQVIENNKGLRECNEDLELESSTKNERDLNDEARISEAGVLVVKRRMQQSSLGDNLPTSEKMSEKNLIQSNINLRYQIKKNRRSAFRDELRDRFDLMFKQIQHEFTQLEDENSILLAKQSEILESVKSNRIVQNQQKAPFNEVT